MRHLLFVFLILLSLCSCSPAKKCDLSQTGETLHILFIGNSYTFANDLPGTFSALSCSAGYKVETGMAAEGGWTLADHVASAQTLAKLNEQKWDYVVLQEQSEIPAIEYFRDQTMYPSVRVLVDNTRKLGAKPLLFLTWGHRDGLPSSGLYTYFDMQAQLSMGYNQIARELGVQVAQVGFAWYKARTQPNPIDLWQEDGSHPNEKGTYLAACAFFAAIFRQTPEGLEYWGGLSQETAQTLQTFAAGSVLLGQ